MKKYKKPLSFLLCVLTVASMLTCLVFPASASTYEYENLTYTVSNGEVTITDCDNGVTGTLVIPGEINNYPVTVIGNWAFVGVHNLSRIVVPNSVITIGECAFASCLSLNSVVIPNSVITIGDSAFSGCSNLKSITIPSSVITIGSSAFKGCHELASIVISNSVTTIGASAFDSTAFYSDSSNWDNGILYIGNHLICAKSTLVGLCYIKDGTRSIASSAFADCTSLTSIVIPSSVTAIGDEVFRYCDNLRFVYILNEGVTLGTDVFSSATNIVYVASQMISVDSTNTNLAKLDFNDVAPSKLYWGYAGTEAVEAETWEEFTALVSEDERLTDKTPTDGETYEMTQPGYYLFWVEYTDEYGTALSFCYTVRLHRYIDYALPHMSLDAENTNLAVLNTADLAVRRVYWGYAGEELWTDSWSEFSAAVPADIRVSDYTPVNGEHYAMTQSGYYMFWIQYKDAAGKTQNICQTVYASGTLDENFGKPYLAFDETGKVAWMDLNGTTVQKMYWGYIGETDYKYSTWDEFKSRIGDTYLPDYGVKDSEGYIVNKTGYYRFVIAYLDAQGIKQERYFTLKSETPAIAPSVDNSTLSNVAAFVNDEGYTSKVYYGYIGTENTKYTDFNTFKANAENFTASYGPKPGTTYHLKKAGYWRFVVNYTVNGAVKDAVYTVYVDEADLALGMPEVEQVGPLAALSANGATVSKVYIGYMGTEAVEIDSWADYTANRQTNATYYGPKDGTVFTMGETAGYYTVVISYHVGGGEQQVFYTLCLDEAALTLGTPNVEKNANRVTLSANGVTVNKVYVGYMGTDAVTVTSWADYAALRKTNTVHSAPRDGATYTLGDTLGYYTVVVAYTVGNAEKLTFSTVWVDGIDLGLPVPAIIQNGRTLTLSANGAAVNKVYIGYMGTDPVEVESWEDYLDLRQTNTTYTAPADGATFTLGNKSGYYTVVVTYEQAGTELRVFYTIQN